MILYELEKSQNYKHIDLHGLYLDESIYILDE